MRARSSSTAYGASPNLVRSEGVVNGTRLRSLDQTILRRKDPQRACRRSGTRHPSRPPCRRLVGCPASPSSHLSTPWQAHAQRSGAARRIRPTKSRLKKFRRQSRKRRHQKGVRQKGSPIVAGHRGAPGGAASTYVDYHIMLSAAAEYRAETVQKYSCSHYI